MKQTCVGERGEWCFGLVQRSGVMFDPSTLSIMPLASKCLASARKYPYVFRRLRALHRIGAVERSGEYRHRETASRPACAGASAQPVTHNPRKQRKNPAAAGSGERFREAKWRRRRDSNPRDGSPSAPLAGVCLRPLGHVSDCGSSRDGGGETRRNSRQGQDRGTGRRGAKRKGGRLASPSLHKAEAGCHAANGFP